MATTTTTMAALQFHQQQLPVRAPWPALSSCRPRAAAVRSSSASGGGVVRPKETVKLTYLEINSWVWEVGGWRILVDPILAGNLDFGAPWLFDAAKKRLKSLGVDEVLQSSVDLLLITQSLDDHCHARTLSQIAAAAPDLPVLTTPNARPILAALPFRHVTYLQPGDTHHYMLPGEGRSFSLRILATPGPVLGPPWQRPENGYILTLLQQQEIMSLYYEPHCVYDRSFFDNRQQQLGADVVITPVVKQLLPGNFPVVAGQEDAVELARMLRARYVVPMCNGDVDAKGLLTSFISTQGTLHAFQQLLADALPDAQLLQPTPGIPLHLHFSI
uniref:Metallo-beta-lactamase domain-containing protein n=1 Tax=Leersia perrieri TaxID=77586 RepID=A0A0D9Y1Y2_9ORYZ